MTRQDTDFQTPSSAMIERSMKRAHELRSAAFTGALRRLFAWQGETRIGAGALAPAE